jgi:hypothetical protein
MHAVASSVLLSNLDSIMFNLGDSSRVSTRRFIMGHLTGSIVKLAYLGGFLRFHQALFEDAKRLIQF